MAEDEAPPVRTAARRYAIRLTSAMAAYAVLLIVTVWLLNADVITGPWRYALAGVPMLGVLAVPAAVIGWLRDADELQRRIALEALAIGFAGGSVLTFGYGFMQLVGAPDISWFAVWPVYAACWLIGGVVANRRYG